MKPWFIKVHLSIINLVLILLSYRINDRLTMNFIVINLYDIVPSISSPGRVGNPVSIDFDSGFIMYPINDVNDLYK